MDSIIFSLSTVPDAITDKTVYTAHVQTNGTLGFTCTVAAVMDAVTKRLSEITGTNRVLIQGQKLGISPDNPDAGVWLVDSKTGDIVATATVERSDSQTVDCVFAEPPAGTYASAKLLVSLENESDPGDVDSFAIPITFVVGA